MTAPVTTIRRSVRYQIVNTIKDAQWDDFVNNHPQGNIFQSRYMHAVYQNTRNYHPLTLFGIDPITGQICGVLSSIIVSETGRFLSSFSSHSIIQGGPLILPGQENILLPLLLEEHDKVCRNKALYSETRNIYNIKEYMEGMKSYQYIDHLNILIKLNQSETDLWHKLHRAKRNQIGRASCRERV